MKSLVFSLVSCVLCLWSVNTFAQDISVEAKMNASQIVLGEAGMLSINIQGAQNVAPVPIPAIDGLDIRYVGPQTQFVFNNGQQSSSISFRYTVFPLKAGHYEIPSLQIAIDGQNYTTNALDIEVTEDQSRAGSSALGSQSSSGTESQSVKDKAFLVLKVPKTEVYLNEPLPVKIMLFVSDFSLTDIEYPVLEALGIDVGKFEQAKQYAQAIGGIRYDIVEFNTVIYPTRTGEVKLGPAKLDCNILAQDRSQNQSRFGRFDSSFDDDFFNQFFGRSEKRPLSLESADVTINVLPLPQEGKPESFSGAVGQFDFQASIGPEEVKVGDPITLRMKIRGTGNLKAANFPILPQDNFKFYDPEIKEENNVKTLEQVIIPQTDQITQVPILQFSYFNPEFKKYEAITQGPFPIKVTKPNEAESLKVVGLEQSDSLPKFEVLGRDIVFIKEEPDKFRSRGFHLYKSLGCYIFLAAFIFLWGGLYMFYRHTHKLQTDTMYAKRLLAPRQARKGLLEAKKLMEQGKRMEFYDTLFKTLQEYLANKFHLSLGAVTLENVQASLNSKEGNETFGAQLKILFDECEMARFAAVSFEKENMRQSYLRLEKLIDYCERHVR